MPSSRDDRPVDPATAPSARDARPAGPGFTPASRDAPPAGIGAAAEWQAERFLEARGLRTLERNFNCRFGEIDRVMLHGEELVFVEVRMRRRDALVDAGESVDDWKQRRLRAAAACYLLARPRAASYCCRFDVVLLAAPDDPRPTWLRHAID